MNTQQEPTKEVLVSIALQIYSLLSDEDKVKMEAQARELLSQQEAKQ